LLKGSIMNTKSFLAIAAFATLAAGAARADDITVDTTPFQSQRTRAEVQAELAQYKQAGVNPWSMTYDPLKSFHSTTTREEVRNAYIADRSQVAALNGEDAGSVYLTKLAANHQRDERTNLRVCRPQPDECAVLAAPVARCRLGSTRAPTARVPVISIRTPRRLARPLVIGTAERQHARGLRRFTDGEHLVRPDLCQAAINVQSSICRCSLSPSCRSDHADHRQRPVNSVVLDTRAA